MAEVPRVGKWAVCILLECFLVTGRNEVVAKVIFLHLFVIMFTGGGGSASVHTGIHPPGADPPGADYPPEQTPPGADTPPRPDPPPGKQTPAYSLRAASTHPTGMHSSLLMLDLLSDNGD